MKKFLLIIAVAVIAAILGTIFYPEKPQETKSAEIVKPWIEVASPKVFLTDESEKEIKELKTGDELENGANIKTSENGFANIYFPDGSVARLDKSSKITISETSYQKTDGKLMVSIFIKTGRVWSKILGLATPDSLWEVKTSNAVATVRGTAFGMEYKNGKSRVVGSENKVAVAPIDPETKKVVESAVVVVEPGTFVSVADEDIKEIEMGELKLEVEQAPDEFFEEDWIKRGIKDDEEIEQKLEEFRKNIEEESEVKSEFKEFIQNKFIDEIMEQRDKNSISENLGSVDSELKALETELEAKINISETKPARIETPEPVPETATTPIRRSTPAAKELRISLKTNLGELSEGVKIPIEAVVSLSDGSARSVTDEVRWEVIGGIGRVESGFFAPKLDASVAEFGKGLGSIVATWKDPATGTEFAANTPIFTVNAVFDQIINTAGQ